VNLMAKKNYKYDKKEKLILYTIGDVNHINMKMMNLKINPEASYNNPFASPNNTLDNMFHATFKPLEEVNMICSSCQKKQKIFLFKALKYLPAQDKKGALFMNKEHMENKPYYTDFVALCESCAVIREIEK